MKLVRNLDDLTAPLTSGAVAIGNFDGVHLGHARIIERLVAKAAEVSGPASVFTFDPHPVRLLRPRQTPLPLTWTDRKAQLVGKLGVDVMIVYPTDERLLELTADEFFDEIVRSRLAARALVEGPNFYFGKGRAGTVEVLRRLCDGAGIELEIVAPVELDGQIVSSSRVRQLLTQGDVGQVRRMLTEPYRLRGMVTHGVGRGAKIGFPTANLEAIDTILPPDGVYAGRGSDGPRQWPAAINIGPNPTFDEGARKVEVHLAGCHRDLYGLPLEVDFFSRLRDIQPFPSIERLRQQLASDVEAARHAFANEVADAKAKQ